MKSVSTKIALVLLVILFSENALQGQSRLFRRRPTLRKRVNPAHERAKTEADKAYQRGEYQKTVDLTTNVIRQNRSDHVAYYLRASALAEIALSKSDAKQMRSAIADAREAISLDSREGMRNPIYYLPYLYGMTNLSVLENKKEHAEVAVRVAGQAISIRTLNSDEKANLYYQRGNSLVVLEKFDEAGADFARAVKLGPTHLGAHLGAADAYARAGKVEQATAAYANAVRSFPNNPLVFNNRGMYFQQQGKLADSIVDFSRALEIDEKYHYAYTNRGFCLLQQGSPKAAEADFTASLKVKPGQPVVYGFRGTARLQQGNVAGAVADNRTVVRLSPRSPAACSPSPGSRHLASCHRRREVYIGIPPRSPIARRSPIP